MRTGPFLPEFAILKAWRMAGARSLTSLMMKLCLVMGIVMPVMSISWKESRPSMLRPTFPVMATTGTESMKAVAMPVTRLVAPGPLVARHTPTRPVTRA